MLKPLLQLALAFNLYFFAVALARLRTELLDRERYSRWVEAEVGP
jgi:heme exporter protein C